MAEPDAGAVPALNADEELPPSPAGVPEPPALPEFLNPESEHYQPWAEKQIFNATKEKRPLEDFLAQLDERLAAYGGLPEPGWNEGRQEQLLARFAPSPARSNKRRRRRRGASGVAGGSVPSQPAAVRRPSRQSGAPGGPSVSPTPGAGQAGGERRRRRRRRSRGGQPGGSPPPTP